MDLIRRLSNSGSAAAHRSGPTEGRIAGPRFSAWMSTVVTGPPYALLAVATKTRRIAAFGEDSRVLINRSRGLDSTTGRSLHFKFGDAASRDRSLAPAEARLWTPAGPLDDGRLGRQPLVAVGGVRAAF